MGNLLIVSVAAGLVFGFLDGLINANPLARRLFAAYRPIAKTSINVPAGVAIDLAYGLVMALLFSQLCSALPGGTGLVKGISFGLLAWFFRTLMGAVSSWMMFTIPMPALAYSAAAGLLEMLVIGMIYGLFLRPFRVM